jgi:hypothetical protein
MSDDAEHFRGRAADCRRLAENARYPEDQRILLQMAEELEAEAESIDANNPNG